MIYSTATVPVNPEGKTRLTRAQAWAGLELKARDARLFLPPGLCTRCEVVEESATHIVREATIGGADLEWPLGVAISALRAPSAAARALLALIGETAA